MFISNHTYKVPDNGAIRLPKEFAAQLDGEKRQNFRMSQGFERGVIMIVPFAPNYKKADLINCPLPAVQNNTITLPESLRDHFQGAVGESGKVTIIGMGKHIEIMPALLWQKRHAQSMVDARNARHLLKARHADP